MGAEGRGLDRDIVDNSFLGLVLFGVKRWDDPTILNSLAVGDSQLAADTPSGRIWHRFTFDGYGEQSDGGDWDLFPDNKLGQTHGRLWPLLTGERGEYELIAGINARPRLRTIANTANDGLMLPEQVWDTGAPPGEQPGEGTRSATRSRGRTRSSCAWPGRSRRASRSSAPRSWLAATQIASALIREVMLR